MQQLTNGIFFCFQSVNQGELEPSKIVSNVQKLNDSGRHVTSSRLSSRFRFIIIIKNTARKKINL